MRHVCIFMTQTLKRTRTSWWLATVDTFRSTRRLHWCKRLALWHSKYASTFKGFGLHPNIGACNFSLLLLCKDSKKIIGSTDGYAEDQSDRLGAPKRDTKRGNVCWPPLFCSRKSLFNSSLHSQYLWNHSRLIHFFQWHDRHDLAKSDLGSLHILFELSQTYDFSMTKIRYWRFSILLHQSQNKGDESKEAYAPLLHLWYDRECSEEKQAHLRIGKYGYEKEKWLRPKGWHFHIGLYYGCPIQNIYRLFLATMNQNLGKTIKQKEKHFLIRAQARSSQLEKEISSQTEERYRFDLKTTTQTWTYCFPQTRIIPSLSPSNHLGSLQSVVCNSSPGYRKRRIHWIELGSLPKQPKHS